jgi:CRISPR-associated exonuclease Cas4
MGWLVLAALVLGSLGFLLLVRSGALRRQVGLPAGRVIYTDTSAWDRCERPLFSDRYRLTGRPDYLVRTRRGVVPVEVKSGTAPPQPYLAHILQLAAYCLLVEEQEGRAPPFGILKYREKAFEIDFTPWLRSELLSIIDDIRHDLQVHDVERSHDELARCQGCGYRQQCEQRLG